MLILPQALLSPTHSSQQPTTEYCETPRKAALKRKLSEVTISISSSRKKIKLLQQSKRRLIKRNASLSNVITEHRKHDLINTDGLLVLEKSAGGVADLVKRQICKQLGKSLPVSYSPELRTFATLH